jgi:hypothetical protein
MRQAHPAGEHMFVDYAGQTVDKIDAGTGEVAAGADVRRRYGRLQLYLRRGDFDPEPARLDQRACPAARLHEQRAGAPRLVIGFNRFSTGTETIPRVS